MAEREEILKEVRYIHEKGDPKNIQTKGALKGKEMDLKKVYERLIGEG